MRLLLIAGFLLLPFSTKALADPPTYGLIKITGIGGGEGTHPYGGHYKMFRVYASSYGGYGSYNTGACAQTGYWFPEGTQYSILLGMTVYILHSRCRMLNHQSLSP